MSTAPNTFQELAALLGDLQRDYPHWQESEIISQIRRSIPEYSHGVWSVAMPFNRGDSDLPASCRERFERVRQRAFDEERLDLAHVFTSIDIKQSFDIVRDAFASWAGDLGTHVLANFTHHTEVEVGTPDSLAGLEDLHGDIDGDNIANHMPVGKAVAAVRAYYLGDEALMNGVTVYRRFRTFARDMDLMDGDGNFGVDREQMRHVFRRRVQQFIELDEIDLDGRHPLRLLIDLFDEEDQAQVNKLLDTTLDQFIDIIASGVGRERDQR